MFEYAKASRATRATPSLITQDEIDDINVDFEGIHPDVYMDGLENDISMLKDLRDTILHDGRVSSQIADYFAMNSPGIRNVLENMYAVEKDTSLDRETLTSVSEEINSVISSIEDDMDERTDSYINHALLEVGGNSANTQDATEGVAGKLLLTAATGIPVLINEIVSGYIAYSVFREILLEKAYPYNELSAIIDALANTEKAVSGITALNNKNQMDKDKVEKVIGPIKPLGLFVDKNSKILQSRAVTSTRAYAKNLKQLGYTRENFKSLSESLHDVAKKQTALANTIDSAIQEMQKNDDLDKSSTRRGVKNVKTIMRQHAHMLKKSEKQIRQMWKKISTTGDRQVNEG